MNTGSKRRLIFLPLLAISLGFDVGCTAFKRFAYEGFGRDGWQQPDRVVEALHLSADDRVADIGAGGGYFTFRLARAVGVGGRVYAVDVDPGMLDYIREQAEDQALFQIETVLAGPADANLPADQIDLVFVSNTFHHLPDRRAYFARLKTSLRPGGRIAVVEVSEGSFPSGHNTGPEEIRADMEAAGYQLVASHDFLERQSFQVFE